MSLVKVDDKFYPNDKYYFVRRSIISYYTRCMNNGEDLDYILPEYMKFFEDMYQVYCKYKESLNG